MRAEGLYEIDVQAARPYRVHIGPGLLARCGQLVGAVTGPCRVMLVTDTNVAPLYADTAEDSLRGVGLAVSRLTLPAGEASKSMDTLARLLEAMADCRLTRRDCVAALGGGVVGDVAGLAAGCYMRGIPYVQLPTTLLAMADASVGGKTAVNLAAGKNLVGLFWQPAAVLCDTACLGTLPRETFAAGMAEVVKAAVLEGEGLFSLLESRTPDAGRTADPDAMAGIIARSVAFKAGVVAADEGESGPRRALNLGHTVGHAIEALSGYTVPHGRAVAAGLAIMTRAALVAGECDPASARRILALLTALGLPTETPYTTDRLAQAALADKKRAGDTITVVWPRAIGDCVLKALPAARLAALMDQGREGTV